MEYRGDTGDPYGDPETGILKNLAGIRDAALLEEYEGEMSIIRQFELSENPLPPSFDLTHLRAIHRHLFHDVYAWAGELRTVDMAKATAASARTFTSKTIFPGRSSNWQPNGIFGGSLPKRSIGRNDSPTTSVKSTPPIPSVKGTDGSSGFSSGISRK